MDSLPKYISNPFPLKVLISKDWTDNWLGLPFLHSAISVLLFLLKDVSSSPGGSETFLNNEAVWSGFNSLVSAIVVISDDLIIRFLGGLQSSLNLWLSVPTKPSL